MKNSKAFTGRQKAFLSKSRSQLGRSFVDPATLPATQLQLVDGARKHQKDLC